LLYKLNNSWQIILKAQKGAHMTTNTNLADGLVDASSAHATMRKVAELRRKQDSSRGSSIMLRRHAAVVLMRVCGKIDERIAAKSLNIEIAEFLELEESLRREGMAALALDA
jgi:hypothetical protein